jgi:tetratricopeptide (TPR) repeat protein
MKILVLPLAVIAACLGLVSLIYLPTSQRNSVTAPLNITMCGPAYNRPASVNDEGKFISALPGWGSYTFPVSTKSDSAQFYFDQGLNLYYGYHFREAVASFRESARLDPANAMGYWGQALAMGPYYNAAHSYTKPPEVSEVLVKMNEAAATATDVEKQLIKSMNSRYSEGPGDADRLKLNMDYAKNLKTLVTQNPGEKEFKVLYVDAMMLIHAWDFWNKDGSAKSWTPELIRLCEQVLKVSPKHPAALHYHIHLTEASRKPQVALASAETLRNVAPGVAHMVHMASHEYERNGLYGKGVEVNNVADDNLLLYDALAKNLSLNKHSAHYFAVQTYCALTGGMYKDAVGYAARLRKTVAPSHDATYDQYLFMLPTMVQVRMGKWDEIMADTTRISPEWSYAQILSSFAKGLAFTQAGKVDVAAAYLARIRENINDPVLSKRRIPFNSPVEVARIAEKILTGAVAFSQKDNGKAIASLEAAVKLEDNLIYTEPKDWPIPSRQFLGAYLIKAGKPAQAELVYREDLVKNPSNGWSLVGLSRSLQAQGKTKQSSQYQARYKTAFARAEEIPSASVYLK